MTEKLFTVKEIGARTGLDVGCIYTLMYKGEFPEPAATKPLRFKASDVSAWYKEYSMTKHDITSVSHMLPAFIEVIPELIHSYGFPNPYKDEHGKEYWLKGEILNWKKNHHGYHNIINNCLDRVLMRSNE